RAVIRHRGYMLAAIGPGPNAVGEKSRLSPGEAIRPLSCLIFAAPQRAVPYRLRLINCLLERKTIFCIICRRVVKFFLLRHLALLLSGLSFDYLPVSDIISLYAFVLFLLGIALLDRKMVPVIIRHIVRPQDPIQVTVSVLFYLDSALVALV